MNGSIRSFERILERFRFREPVPQSVQEHVLISKRKALIGVLKTVNDYSLVYGAVLVVYFASRRIGLRLSVAQSKLAIAAAVIVVTAAVLLASWLFATRSLPRDTSGVDRPSASAVGIAIVGEERKKVLSDEKIIDEKTAPIVKYRVGVETFTSEIVDRAKRDRIADSITNSLARLAGAEKVVRLGRAGRKNVNRVLLGSVEKLGDTYIITARIVDVEKSRVLFSASENVDSSAGIDDACALIARKAVRYVE